LPILSNAIDAVVFDSEQGLVGQFNDVVADYAVKTLAALQANSFFYSSAAGPLSSGLIMFGLARICIALSILKLPLTTTSSPSVKP
jgi:hypothetical protein